MLSSTQAPIKLSTTLTSLNQILHLLADGDFHSGTAIGQCLNISRAAVWKQLRGLDAMGVTIHRVKGKGYRIDGGLDLLDLESIYRSQPNLSDIFSLRLLMQAESTNAVLMQQASSLGQRQSIHGQVVLAELQTMGRGRMGRPWHTPFAQQIALSLGWQFDSLKDASGVSLIIGLAVVDVLQKIGIKQCQLKWPNDVLIDDKKTAGILIELVGGEAGFYQLIIGIGINVYGRHYPHIDNPWTCLQDHGFKQSRNYLVGQLLTSVATYLQQFSELGLKPFIETWQSHHRYHNHLVTLSRPNHTQTGVCRGVDIDGALLLEVNGKIHKVHGGEISLRPTLT